MLNVRGFVTGLFGWFLPGTTALVVTIALSACIAIWTVKILRSRRPDYNAAFCISVTAATLVSYHLYVHDLSVMLIPLGLMGGVKNSPISKATVALYLALPFLLIVRPKLLFLLVVPVALLLHGVFQIIRLAAARSDDRIAF
jgi:hypothetical protein